jgi:hypothetical protein
VDAVALVDDRERRAPGPAFQELAGVMNALVPGKGMGGAGAGGRNCEERQEG